MAKSTPPPPVTDITAAFEAVAAADVRVPESALTPEARAVAAALETPVAEAKPDISRLPDAIVGGRLIVPPGDKIVIERRASFLAGNPYLDTRTYTVKGVDEATGRLSLWDDFLQQWASDNFIAGPKNGQVYKVALSRSVSTKKKRGRPRKNPVAAPSPAPVGPDGAPVKKRRGRPAGSKNRPKEEIRAEREAKRAARAR